MSQTFDLIAALKFKSAWSKDFGATVVNDRVNLNETYTLGDEYGSSNVTQWRDQIDVATSGTTIDLQALTTKAFGGTGTMVFTSVSAVYLCNKGTESITAFQTVSNQWTNMIGGELVVPAGASFFVYTPEPWDVTASNKAVKFSSTGTDSVLLDAILVGVST